MKINAKLAIMGALLTSALPCLAVGQAKPSAKPTKKPITQKAETEAEKHYTVITDMAEYNRVCKSRRPTIIAYNSSTCTACDMMEPGFNECAKKYPQADFYCLDAQDDAFKGLTKKANIKGYPTTHFIRPGKPPRIERGSMGAQELDSIVYEFVHGKRKPFVRKAEPVEIKKSLQEETE